MCNVTIQSCNSLEENLEILQKNKWQIVLLYDNIFFRYEIKEKDAHIFTWIYLHKDVNRYSNWFSFRIQ